MLNLRLTPAVSRITLPELTFTSKYALRVIYDFEVVFLAFLEIYEFIFQSDNFYQRSF